MGYSTVRRIMREGLTDPRNLGGIALWNSTRDVTDLTTDTGIKLWADKSGNSSTNVLCLNGVAGNDATSPDSAALNPAGDFAGAVYVGGCDWTPAADMTFISHIGGAGNRGFRFALLSTGAVLNLQWSYDGTNLLNASSTVATGLADFSNKHVGFIVDVNNGAGGSDVSFWMSDDGITWTQLGTTVTVAGTGTLFNTTAIMTAGSQASSSNFFTGVMYYAKFLNTNLSGTPLWYADFRTAAKLATSFTESSSNAATVTINTSGATGARISGARDLVNLVAANQPILTIAAGGNYLTFDGSNDYLKAAAFALAQPETVYFVGSQVTWTSTDRLYDGNGGASMVLRQVGVTPQLGITAGSSVNGASLTLATNGVVTSVFNGASSAVRVNRTAAVTGDAGALGNGGGFTLGSANDGTLNANITASEVLVYSTAQDENYQYRVTRLLSRRTGVLVA